MRLWSFTKAIIIKNTTKLRANTFGFYAINGESVIEFKEDSKTDSFCSFLMAIRQNNPLGKIVIILDNFRAHKNRTSEIFAEKMGIILVFLPPYSPDLNPIKYIWKSIKRTISPLFISSVAYFKGIIEENFLSLVKNISYAKNWIIKFLPKKFKQLCH